MTSLGRLIVFDQPGTGVSDPVTSGALPTWSNGPTASPRCSTISGVAKRSSSRAPARSRRGRCLRRHIRPAPPRWSRSRATRLRPHPHRWVGSRGSRRRPGRHVGHWGGPACLESRHALERGDPDRMGTTRTLGGQPKDPCSDAAGGGRNGRPGGASDNPRANPRRAAHRRLVDRPRHRQVRRRPHPRREVRRASRAQPRTTSLNHGASPSRRSPRSSPATGLK